MKTNRIALLVLILIALFTITKRVSSQTIQINTEFTKDTLIFPFDGIDKIFSLEINGRVRLLSDTSLVRIIVIDQTGNQFLAFEAYPLITAKDTFSIRAGCDETCFTEGFFPSSLRIDIINCRIIIDSLHLVTTEIIGAIQLQSAIKHIIDSIKISSINQNIIKSNMYWRAGKTSFIDWKYKDKENFFGLKFNLLGFDYYKGGVFESNNKRNHTQATSTYVDSFDWRRRHGANQPLSPYFDGDNTYLTGWITPVRDQGSCGTCSIFATVGAVEGRLNLYYNLHNKNSPHHADINISEQDIRNCPTLLMPCNSGSYPSQSYNRLQSYRCQEFDYIYNPINISCAKPTNCQGEVKIQYYTYNYCTPLNEDLFKIKLFDYGPLTVTIPIFPIPGGTGSHAVAVVGYEKIQAGKVVYKSKSAEDKDIVIDNNSALIGTTIYWFKNSWNYNPTPGGTPTWGEDGFGCIEYNSFESFDFATGKVFWEGMNEDPNSSGTSIQCSDEDGDGYYWWGISQTTPCASCPTGIDVNEDCDDSDRDLGPYDVTYACNNNCDFVEQPFPVSTYTVNDQHHFKSSIIIQNGITLTLNNTVFMAPGRIITVKKGGTLIITGQGKITSACTQLWGGIEVEGENLSQTPSNQGIVVLQAGSIIENAICGIKSIKASSFSTGTGAIITATNANFINNRTAVNLTGYSSPITQTFFNNCLFKTTEILLDNSNPAQLVYLEGLANTDCIEFKGCIFENTGLVRFGKGIKAYNSFFSCSNNGATPNTFINFKNAIYATGSNTTSLNVENCVFNNNAGAVYVSAGIIPRIKLNTINVALISGPNPDNSGGGGTPVPLEPNEYTAYGICLDACSGYLVEDNFINSALYSPGANNEAKPCGIYIRNSGPNANEIYRNSLSNLYCGIAAFGINRNGIGDGLNLKCNTITNCGTDIGIYRGATALTANTGIKKDQGVPATPDADKSAGNVFSSLSFQYHTKDIDNTRCMPIWYNHHRTQTIPPNLRMIPLAALSPGVTINQNTQSYYSSSASCPTSIGDNHSGNGWVQQADSLIEKAESFEAILLQQVDGGNTAGTTQDLLYSTPDETFTVYTDLLDKSPYLSDTVMKTAVLREDLLPEVMLRDILVANPQSAKSDTVLKAIDNRFAPLNDTLMGDIMANEYILGNKEILEMQLAEAWQHYGIALNNRKLFILSDSTITHTTDSLAAVYTLSERLPDRYDLALLYAQTGNPATAGAVMNSITKAGYPNNYSATEHNGYINWIGLVDRAVANGAELAFDSLQVNSLFGLMSDDTLYNYYPAVYARNCLLQSGLITYQEPLVYDQELKSAKVRKHYPKIAIAPDGQGYLKIFPNPARDYVIIEYQLKEGCTDGFIQVYAIDGKNILKIPVHSNNSEVVLPVGKYLGSFIVSLQGCSGLIDRQKIVLNR